jgi:hypothetical protein
MIDTYADIMVRKTLIIGIVGMLLLLMLTNAYAYTGIENITLSSYSANASQGGNVSVSYNLTKSSGYYSFGTTLYVVASKQLGTENVTVILTKNFGNPPISGVMYIFLTHGTAPGAYNITLAGNSTGVLVNPGTFILNVLPPVSSSTSTLSSVTTTSTTVVSTSMPQTSIPSTVPKNNGQSGSASGNNVAYLVFITIIVVLIIIILLLIGFRFRAAGKEKPS